MLKELGQFKTKFALPLCNSELVKTMLLGSDYQSKDIDVETELKKYIISNLCVNGVVNNTDTYIFYDVVLPRIGLNIKTIRLITYVICHKDKIDDISNLSLDIKKNYYGNRVDRLCQIIEEIIINNKEISREFGIGEIKLEDVNIYNSDAFYGRILTFEVPNFR